MQDLKEQYLGALLNLTQCSVQARTEVSKRVSVLLPYLQSHEDEILARAVNVLQKVFLSAPKCFNSTLNETCMKILDKSFAFETANYRERPKGRSDKGKGELVGKQADN